MRRPAAVQVAVAPATPAVAVVNLASCKIKDHPARTSRLEAVRKARASKAAVCEEVTGAPAMLRRFLRRTLIIWVINQASPAVRNRRGDPRRAAVMEPGTAH